MTSLRPYHHVGRSSCSCLSHRAIWFQLAPVWSTISKSLILKDENPTLTPSFEPRGVGVAREACTHPDFRQWVRRVPVYSFWE